MSQMIKGIYMNISRREKYKDMIKIIYINNHKNKLFIKNSQGNKLFTKI